MATLFSSDEYEKAAEAGSIKFDEYEMAARRSEFLLDLAEFNMGVVMYNALLENSTSELGSRMQSMENSTKNAKDMLGKLTLLYNRTRQASITTELARSSPARPRSRLKRKPRPRRAPCSITVVYFENDSRASSSHQSHARAKRRVVFFSTLL